MNFEVDIELYSEEVDEVVYDLLEEKLESSDIAKILKKLEHYQQLTLSNLLAAKKLDLVNGSNPRLYELKIKSLSRPVRFVCSLEGKTILLLDVLFSSGSGGAVEKHIKQAAVRLEKWRSRNLN